MAEKIKKVAQRTAAIEKEIDVEGRKVNLCFMTEAICRNWYIPEVCLCEKENADLTRFENGIAPVLFNHDRDKVIGRIDNITFENKRANATIVFDTDAEAEAVFQKVQSGSLRGVSVGYIRQSASRIMGTEEMPIEFMGKTYNEVVDVTTKWELLEISVVSVPADNDTGIGRELCEAEIDVVPVENLEHQKEEKKEKKTMNEEIQVNVDAERATAIQAERARTSEIMALCKAHSIATEKQEKFINDGLTVDAVRAAILDELTVSQKPSATVNVTEAEADKVRAAMVGGLCRRYGVDDKVVSGAERFEGASLRALSEEILEREGTKGVRFMETGKLYERAMGSGAFVGIIDDFANKVKLKAYTEQPFIWSNFVSFGKNKDFKPVYKYEMGLSGLPKLMAQESGEFPYEEVGDAKVSTMIATYGKAIRFTREIFINDDLGQVADVIRTMAGGFARHKEIMFFDLLTKLTYSQANGNLVKTNKNISAKAYSEMKMLSMKQMDINKEGYVGVAPFAVIAPIEQEDDHAVLLTSTAMPGQENPGVTNTARNKFKLFTTPYLSGNPYFTACNPAQRRGIEYTTLAGQDGVQSRSVVLPNYLGIDYQMWDDYGFNVLDPRAFIKNENNA